MKATIALMTSVMKDAMLRATESVQLFAELGSSKSCVRYERVLSSLV